MAGMSYAGPEWEYLAPHTSRHGPPTDLDSLFVNIIIERKVPKSSTEKQVLNLQSLITKNDQVYRPNDVTRFSFPRFRELTRTWDLDLFFYEGVTKHGVAIPDEQAFQRLLLAVRHLGLGAPLSPSAPPVMKFFARPPPPPEMSRLLLALYSFSCIILIGFIWALASNFGAGAVVVLFLVIYGLVEERSKAIKRGARMW
ncbi:hypothetical protein KVR01_010260 [Diaporthe batatas]|uniref:uncharacterized protein n=1 Tax=Diaporthe batatas TaxID=748121 RepID=UPI001D03DF4D|nr:uncharacterized protein KVR01_010260 [Diaporthe batatas]KAG8159623.1 hypothetical protein KVR01_010260 [Diaporthe batatas]